MLLSVRVPAGNDRGPVFMDQALSAIHQADHRRLPITLTIASSHRRVALFCDAPPVLQPIIERQILARYPDGLIEQVDPQTLRVPRGHRVWRAELCLIPDILPIRRYPEFVDPSGGVTADPLAGVLGALEEGTAQSVHARVDLEVRPARHGRVHVAHQTVACLMSPALRARPVLSAVFLRLTSASLPIRWLALCIALVVRHRRPLTASHTWPASRTHDREDLCQAAEDKLGRHLFEVRLRLTVHGPVMAEQIARRRLEELAGAFGQFSAPRLATFHHCRTRRRQILLPVAARASLLSAEEVATLWHPATVGVRAPGLSAVESRELEPPVALPLPGRRPDLAILGRIVFRDRHECFGILPDDRRRHLLVLGKTGMGKSTLLRQMLDADIRAGRGVALIDPHGDLADAALECVPRGRTNDVIVFDAADTTYPISFNLLVGNAPHMRPLIASGIVAAFRKLYADSWGPRLEHVLRNAVLALLEVPGTSLVSLMRLLADAPYRASVLTHVRDPVVRAFWDVEFAGMPPKLRAEAIAPVQNKIGHFVSSPLLRNIVGQPRAGLNLRSVMDDGKILIVNLSKGRIGDDASQLLGSLLVTAIQLAAMSRAETPEERRRDFYLYVDEFQNFATESFATILSEARKYRLNLTLANQYLAQLDEATAHAVFGNVGSILTFQVGAHDADILAGQLGGGLLPEDLLTLARYRAYARLLIDGMPSRPFSMQTLAPPPRPLLSRTEVIRRTSQQRYGHHVAAVESEINSALALPV